LAPVWTLYGPKKRFDPRHHRRLCHTLSPGSSTTKLYDRTGDEITLDEVERITKHRNPRIVLAHGLAMADDRGVIGEVDELFIALPKPFDRSGNRQKADDPHDDLTRCSFEFDLRNFELDRTNGLLKKNYKNKSDDTCRRHANNCYKMLVQNFSSFGKIEEDIKNDSQIDNETNYGANDG
jgi:hypothetical protein